MSGKNTGTGPVLGDLVEIRCRYCKLNMDATVSAVVDGRIEKVMCRTCRNFQDYRPPVDEAETRRKMLRKALRMRERRTGPSRDGKGPGGTGEKDLSAQAVARRLWDEATKDANPLKSKIYAPGCRLAKDELVTHPKHGLGVVVEVDEKSAKVLFRTGFVRLDV